MKALTICQPYAELIAADEKLVENRVWSTPYRGLLLIHAGKSEDWLKSYEPLPPRMDFGKIIAVASLIECVQFKRADTARKNYQPPKGYHWLLDDLHAEGPWCWILQDVKRLPKPIPANGRQGIWEVQGELLAQVEKQLRKAKGN